MCEMTDQVLEIQKLVLHQLDNYFFDVDDALIRSAVPQAINCMRVNFSRVNNSRLYQDDLILNTDHSITWMIFLYRLSHELGKNETYRVNGMVPKEADKVYYLNKIMHSVDWFHQIDLPQHFMCEHPLGSVLGRAKYGDYLMVYQGTTIGGNRREGQLFYPTIGNNVVLYANATVLGNSVIGDNVILSSGTYLIDEVIPDNCIVFGKSPNLVVKKREKKDILKMTDHIWRW